MLIPVSISVSQLALNIKKNKTLVSTTHIAYFGNGVEKMLNKKAWIPTSLVNTTEVGYGEPINTYLSKNSCTLFYRDWSNNPIFGDFNVDYPPLANFLMP